jgi:hypothetical protein
MFVQQDPVGGIPVTTLIKKTIASAHHHGLVVPTQAKHMAWEMCHQQQW